MAETNSVHAAETVLDKILEQGAGKLYEAYIKPKIRPFAAA